MKHLIHSTIPNRLRSTWTIALIGTLLLTSTPVQQAESNPGIITIIKELTKRAIKAIDLKVQRLQNKTIGLQNLQKAIENKLSQLKLSEIAQWVDKQRDLFKKFYDELWKVKSAVSTYKRVRMIIERQQQLVEEYRFTWHMINQDKHFTKEEISYMYRVYTGILDESVHNLNQLLLVINSFKTQMSDAKRLEIINKAGDNIEQNYMDLQKFNEQNIQLSMMRAKDQHEIEAVRKLYGLE